MALECHHGWGDGGWTVDRETNVCSVCGKIPLYWSEVNPHRWHTADGWERKEDGSRGDPAPQNPQEFAARYAEIVLEYLRGGRDAA